MQQEDLFPDFIEFPLIQDDDIPGIRCSEGDNGEIGTSDRGSGAIGHLDEACELSGQLQTLPFPTGLSNGLGRNCVASQLAYGFQRNLQRPRVLHDIVPVKHREQAFKIVEQRQRRICRQKRIIIASYHGKPGFEHLHLVHDCT